MTTNEDAPAGQGQARRDHHRGEDSMAARPHLTPAEQYRQFAAVLDQHPDMRPPAHVCAVDIQPTYGVALAKSKRIGGVWEMDLDPDGYPILSRRIGPVDYRILVESGGRDDIARENAARDRLDGYCERAEATARRVNPAYRSLAELGQDGDEWANAPHTRPTRERAVELRAQGWTPVNHDTQAVR